MDNTLLVAVNLLQDQVGDSGSNADEHRRHEKAGLGIPGIDAQRAAPPGQEMQPEIHTRHQHEETGGDQDIVVFKKAQAGVVSGKTG